MFTLSAFVVFIFQNEYSARDHNRQQKPTCLLGIYNEHTGSGNWHHRRRRTEKERRGSV